MRTLISAFLPIFLLISVQANANQTYDDLNLNQKKLVVAAVNAYMVPYSKALDSALPLVAKAIANCGRKSDFEVYPWDLFNTDKSSACYQNAEAEQKFYQAWKTTDPKLPKSEYTSYRDYQTFEGLILEVIESAILAKYTTDLIKDEIYNSNYVNSKLEPVNPTTKGTIEFEIFPEAFSRGDGCLLGVVLFVENNTVEVREFCD